MKDKPPEELKEEAVFFDTSIRNRTSGGTIPIEADYRRATKYLPNKQQPEKWTIDTTLYKIVQGDITDDLIQRVTSQGGKVLDICCGPGWLSLEFARNGLNVKGYDISESAINTARRMARENPFLEGFGKLEYFCQDVNKIEFNNERYSTIVGCSAFHHVYGLDQFLESCYQALEANGLMVTFDDIGYTRTDSFFRYFFMLILPTFRFSYLQKLNRCVAILTGKRGISKEIFSPMEIYAGKHTTASDKILEFWSNRLKPEKVLYFGAFSVPVCNAIRGPDWFRYGMAWFLTALDKLLVKLNICRGYYRVIYSRK